MTSAKKREKQLEALWPDLQRGDANAIHEARKLTRKVGAELRVSGAPGKVKRAWRDLRRAIAPVRDLDATLAHLREGLRELGAPDKDIGHFEASWQAGRAERWEKVELPQPPPVPKRPKDFAARARERARKDWQALVAEARGVLDSDDIEAWHTWRKHLKAYRYTLDLLADTPPELEDLLQALGRLQDAQVAREALEGENNLVPKYKEALLEREDAAARQSQGQVRGLWGQLLAASPDLD